MKKFKKVLSFVAAFTMAMAVAAPVSALADVTLKINTPADWTAQNIWIWEATKGGEAIDELTNPDDIPSEWPGFAVTNGTYTVKADNFKFIISNDGGTPQTVDLDYFATGDAKTGTYVVTVGEANEEGKHAATIAAEGEAATPSDDGQTPPTGDATPVILVSIIGVVALASVVVVLATRKKAIA